MRRETIIAGLICLNLGLLAALGFVLKKKRAAPAVTAASSSLSVAETNVPRWVKFRRQGESAARPANQSSRFTWRQLQAREFKQFVANLRGVECPEETVKDIVVAEINRQFAPREAALKARREDFKPWESDVVRGEPDYARRRKLRELVSEKRATLKEILGYEVPVEYPPTIGSSSTFTRFEQAYARLPEEKRERARAVMEAFWSRQDALAERTKGFWEPEDREEQQKIQRQRRDELASLLTPDEFVDFEMATSSRASNLRSQLSVFEPSDAEFREIFRLRQALEDAPQPAFDPEDREGNRQRAEAFAAANRQVEEQIKATLGDQRYAEYQRAQDYNFRNLTQISQEYGLPREAAIKAYEAQRFAQEESARVRSDPQLTPEQRNQTLQTMQGELDNMLTGILGERGWERFRGYGGARVWPPSRGATRVTQTILNPDGTRTVIMR